MVHTIYTIGHSCHDLDSFFALLTRYGIDQIIDIRRSPRSTRYPHFNIDRLKEECSSRSSFKYSFQGDILGGRRRRRRRSLGNLNNALSDSDSHGYADHMQRITFQQIVNQLVSSTCSPSVLMCSENTPEQCHRLLLADYLSLVHHLHVVHILFDGETRDHRVHPQARLADENNTCIYPSGGLPESTV